MCAEDMRSEWLDVYKFEDRASFVRVYRRNHKEYTDFLAEVIDVLVHDETSVCFRGRVGGKQTGRLITPNGDYPPTGRPYAVEFLCWLQTTDGLITRATYAFNLLSIWAQLGHLAEP